MSSMGNRSSASHIRLVRDSPKRKMAHPPRIAHIIHAAAGNYHTILRRKDGQAFAVGDDNDNQGLPIFRKEEVDDHGDGPACWLPSSLCFGFGLFPVHHEAEFQCVTKDNATDDPVEEKIATTKRNSSAGFVGTSMYCMGMESRCSRM